MSIFNHFQQLTLSHDQEEALKKIEAFINSSAQVFILKGYAGSGKTTLLAGLTKYLSSGRKKFLLMAPTGRAAKILRDKTGAGKTIHSCIYDFQNLVSVNANSEEDADHSFHYSFPIRNNDEEALILIVDESSMISSKESKNELFTFGTNILLNDLLSYSKLSISTNKIIFVGDPAQLPPVGDNTSKGLQEHYFSGLGLKVESIELTEVKRQTNNLILTNARKLRSLLGTHLQSDLKFEYDQSSFIKQIPENITEKYVSSFPTPQVGNGVIIAFSNAQCLYFNKSIREKIYPLNLDVVAGDILLINNNNYHSYGTELFNGDMAQVVEINSELELQSAPVWVDEAGNKTKKTISLAFRNVVIRVPGFAEDIHCKIIDSLLNSTARDLSMFEMKALYINFMMRFNEQQKIRSKQGLDVFKVGSDEFKNSLKSDPYFNALRVKYGYAITCHKSQGGEWETVFVDYYGRVGLNDDQLRWCYTATTRAKECCYAINAPHFGLFSKLSISEIIAISRTNFPKEAINFNYVPTSPFHFKSSNICKSWKYWELSEKLDDSPYLIINAESKSPYLERYTIGYGDKTISIQATHTEGGFFGLFSLVSSAVEISKEVTDLLSLISAPYQHRFDIDYTPDSNSAEELFSSIQGICSENGITITNVIENKKQYFVTYYFFTSGSCSYIQFYYNQKGQFTKALPKSDLGHQDKKLTVLIAKLNEYAS